MAQLLRYGESNFWFVSSCNGLRVFAAVWPYSPGSQSRCRTVRFEFIRPVARLRHLIGQLKFTLSQARNRQTVTCAASLVVCAAHSLIGRTRCPWQACSGGPRSVSADAVGFVQSPAGLPRNSHRCARISSRRGSKSTSIPTARMPSFTGRNASAAMTRKERSGMRKTPLKSARRPARGNVDNGLRCPQSHRNKSRSSGHLMRYQNCSAARF